MHNGYIKLHRKFLDWYGYSSSRRVHLWITLLMLANHKENRFIFNGEPTTVSRGTFITGRLALSKTTNIPPTSVERMLQEFEKEGIIEQQKTNKNRLIKILYYDRYQVSGQQMDNKRTTDGQQMDTNKNDKNVKNEKKYTKGLIDPPINLFNKIKGIKNSAQISAGWARNSKAVKALLDCAEGNSELVCKVIKNAEEYFGGKNLSWTLETIIKNWHILEDLKSDRPMRAFGGIKK